MTMELVKVTTGLDKLSQISDPAILSNLYDQWKALEKIGTALEKKVKGIATENKDCGDWYFEEQGGTREITDADQAELIAATVMSAKEINSCKTLNLTALEKTFIERVCLQFGCSKEEAKSEFSKRFESVINQKTKKVLKRRQLSLKEAIDDATINPEF